MTTRNWLGVVVVAFNSAPVIVECLESLCASANVELSVVVVDNHCEDDTGEVVEGWASGSRPFVAGSGFPVEGLRPVPKPVTLEIRDEREHGPLSQPVTLIRSSTNLGFAGGVNLGMRALLATPDVGPIWILNPDCVVRSDVAELYLRAAAQEPYSLMTGRTVYYAQPDAIQTDGGVVDNWTGVCRSVNQGRAAASTPPPDPRTLSFVTGANMVASREFIDQAGLMDEHYFLYYEEVDWAMRRRDLPLAYVPEAIVYHHGGTTIGTGSIARRASPFANYFNYRNRVRFAHRFMASRQAFVFAFGLAKAAQLAARGALDESAAVLAGVSGWRPPAAVAAKVRDPRARQLAFGDAA